MKERDHFLNLIGRHTDGIATPEEARELEAALLKHPELRQEFLRYLHLDAALAGTAPALHLVREEPLPGTRRHRAWWVGLAAAAAVLLLAFGLPFLARKAESRKAATPALALLAAANDAVWADPNVELALRSGELPQGLLELDSGTAEFVCADGATVVLRGPSVVRFLDRKRVLVENGRVFFRCPTPESRLMVETPSTQVVDLGTEFTVDARKDRSTLVAVLSGEVQVGRSQPRRLRKGEAVEVRGDGILAIQPMTREDFAELLLASPEVGQAVESGANLLRDPGFENGLSRQTWNRTEGSIDGTEHGRSGKGVRVAARGTASWPQCHQTIEMDGLAGRLVVASVWAAVMPGDPLRARQTALLKIAFKNEEGRDFAFATQRFLRADSEPGRFEHMRVAAFAPPGTRRIQLQLMLQSELKNSGAVLFDDASLIITDAPPPR